MLFFIKIQDLSETIRSKGSLKFDSKITNMPLKFWRFNFKRMSIYNKRKKENL